MQNRHMNYPVVIDFDHRMADLYKAETTPHFFLLDRQGLARYVGALDDATAEARDARVYYLDKAVSALLSNRSPSRPSPPPMAATSPARRARPAAFQP